MKIGLISDIHANKEALEAVLEEMEADKVLCAGDLTGYGADPNEVIETIRDKEIMTVRGNHDAKAVHQLETAFNPSAELALEYNREYLEDENWEYLEDLPEMREQTFEDIDISILHGSPDEPLEGYVYRREVGKELIDENFEKAPDVLVLGHTHVPFVKETENCVIVNPGSVGQPRDRNPKASYAVLDTEDMSVDIKRTTYDIEKAAEKVKEQFTSRLSERLREGR